MQAEFIKYLQINQLDFLDNNTTTFRTAIRNALDDFLLKYNNNIPKDKRQFTVVVQYAGNLQKEFINTEEVICTGYNYLQRSNKLQLEVYSSSRKNVLEWLQDNLNEFGNVTFI